MKISVIIPVYNTEKLLNKCIMSIINQTLNDIEIILINDGSTDNSLDIILDFAKKDNRIIVINQGNKGLSGARNAGIDIASGDYLSFIDSDDYIEPTMMEEMYNAIIKFKCDVAVCNYRWVYDDMVDKPILHMKNEVIQVSKNRGEFINNFLMCDETVDNISHNASNKIFSREFIKNNNLIFEPNSEIFAEDGLFFNKALLKLDNMVLINKCLYNYYQHENSIMHSYKVNLLKRWIEYFTRLEKCYKQQNIIDMVQKGINQKCFNIFVDLIYNELKKNLDYCHIRSICKDEYLYSRASNCNYKLLNNKKKIIYFMYKFKMFYFLYLTFKWANKRIAKGRNKYAS